MTMVPMDISRDVAEAQAAERPVVALESTIITHGMPYPQNIETARLVENVIRENGATPATIAVIDGRLKIGLSEDILSGLGQTRGVAKLSRADLATCIAAGGTGATTVAATMIAARLAGIEVFATGGVGGVHKGAETSFDISADLREFSATQVTVVAAGAKAILDLPKTLEVLETLGVPVIAYGQDSFPAFWSRSSGLNAPIRMDTPDEIAAAHILRGKLGLSGGQLVGNPIPEASEIPANTIGPIIKEATANAEKAGIRGKALTPYLLQRIYELTEGASLKANIALVENNARLAAKISSALIRQRKNT